MISKEPYTVSQMIDRACWALLLLCIVMSIMDGEILQAVIFAITWILIEVLAHKLKKHFDNKKGDKP